MSRLKIIFGVFTLGLILVVLRLVDLQVLKHSKYEVLAGQQHFFALGSPAPRGRIFSEDGFLLASNEVSYLLYAEPKELSQSPENVVKAVVPILYPELFSAAPKQRDITAIKNNEENIIAGLSRPDLFWVALKHEVTLEQKSQIEALSIGGLDFEEESTRFYPQGNLAREVLGIVGRNNTGQSVGYFGVEGYYDGDLQGRGGKVYQEQNAFGQPILVGDYLEVPSLPGRDLNLTIKGSLQHLLEKKLISGISKYGAESGVGIIMDPGTGAILAMSSQYAGASPEASTSGVPRNLAISSTYEPGSVIKPLTMSAAIEERVVSPDDTYNDTGPVSYSGHLVDNWDLRHHGVITMAQILELSNNLGAAWVGAKLGSAALRDYLLRFGFNNLLGVDLQGETGGIIRDVSEWRDIDTATASFGQGIAATPLQVLNIYATIANGGYLVRPHVLSGETVVIRKVLSKQTSEAMVKMLTAAVDLGEARFFNLKNYTVAGKTGTAQIAIAGRYDPQKSNTTFVGFLPKDPRFVMLVKLEKPSTSIYAAETAVPLWMDIAASVAIEMRLLPDR
jgi:cell division protein FtsI/penicillin-binding protein 2